MQTTENPHQGGSKSNSRRYSTTPPPEPPPHSIETEQYCLGGMMQDPDSWPAVSKIISGSDFYLEPHRVIFNTIKAQAEKGDRFDLVTVAEQLDSAGVMVDTDPLPGIEPNNWRYLETTIDQTATAVNVASYARIVRRKSLERRRQTAIAKGNHHQAAAITAEIDRLEAAGRQKSRFITTKELCSTPPAETWLVKGYAPTDSIGTWWGDTEAGKSFLLIDLACHIATGRPWRGRSVKQGAVVYIAGEGKNGLSKRFRAWFERHGIEDPDNIFLLTTSIQLTDHASVGAVLEEIKALPIPPNLIIVDTVNRNFGPGDENSTNDMTMAVAGLDALRTTTGATVIGAHHCGLTAKDRGRGSSVLKASLDFEFSVEKFDRTVQIRCTKAKDFDHPPPLAWTFEQQALPWSDEEGTPINSAVLIPTDVVSRQSSAAAVTQRERIALSILEQQGPMLTGDWRAAFYESVRRTEPDIKPDTLRRAWTRIEPKLIDSKMVIVTGNLVSLPGQPGHDPDISGLVRPTTPGQPGRTGHTPIGVSGLSGCLDSPDIADSETRITESAPDDDSGPPDLGPDYMDSLVAAAETQPPPPPPGANEPTTAVRKLPRHCDKCHRYHRLSRNCGALPGVAIEDPNRPPCMGKHFEPTRVQS